MLQNRQPLSFRTRFLMWRARLSTPALLMRFEERKVISVVSAINGGLAILALGWFAWLTDLPLIFPALGPSAFILFTTPLARVAAPRNVVTGHLVGLTVGFVVCRAMCWVAGGEVDIDHASWLLSGSASLALAVTCLALVWVASPHPPACASALVIVLSRGTVTLRDVVLMAAAVICLTGMAVVMNRWAGLRVPFWCHREAVIDDDQALSDPRQTP